MGAHSILVLGGYGLAGRAIVEGLIAQTSHNVTAAGRDPERLRLFHESIASNRLQTQIVDVTDEAPLRKACEEASVVINAVGPYARHGAQVARIAVECGRPYIDCANEQIHYNQLKELDSLAQDKGVPMVTAAGAIPGVSGLLAAYLLKRLPEANRVDFYWAQFRNVDESSGVASLLSGILEVGHGPVALTNNRQQPIALGHSMTTIDLPRPFHEKRMLEAPTIECLTLPSHFSLSDVHSWFYFGDLPLWLFDLIRVLRPYRWNWSYRLVEWVTRYLNNREVAEAVKKGLGAEGLLVVRVRAGDQSRSGHILFKNGAVATAALPVRIADGILNGQWQLTGLATPLDLFEPQDAIDCLGDAVIRQELDEA